MPKGHDKNKIEKRDGIVFYGGVRASEMIAYPISVVLALTGWSRITLWREVQLGRIKMTANKRVPRAELERYFDLRGEPKT